MADSADFPRRTVVVLGATDFVGSRLVQTLANSVEFRPLAAKRRRSQKRSWPGVRTLAFDPTDPRAIGAAISGVDYVVSCTARNARTRVAVTSALCIAARQRAPRRIVHLSSMAVYGQATGLVRETTLPITPLSEDARRERICERLLQDYVRDGGDAVILRPGCIHGPGSTHWTSRIARLLRAGRIGDMGAAGDGICNLTYIDDLVTAMLSALTRPALAGAVFNIVGKDLPTWNEYFVRFARALSATPVYRLSARRISAECRLIAPALVATQRALRLAGLPSSLVADPITPSLARLWQQDIRLDTSQAAACLDLLQTPLDRALNASVLWLTEGARAGGISTGARCDQPLELGRL
jgi:nucleoside-diphosphate-sugar epimerase